MTPQHIQLVQNSIPAIAPVADEVAATFYRTLLTRNPGLAPLFARTDMAAQGKALMGMIVWAVQRLNNVDELLPQLRALGQRHVRYGVRTEHYAQVGDALLATLHSMLGAQFTPELREAWTAVYGVVAQTMGEGERVVQTA